MGGDSYDREVYSAAPAPANAAPAQAHAAFSAASASALTQHSLHRTLNPRQKHITCPGSSGIVIALDVTGSMGDWTRIVYDKLPMFYGQLLLQGYVENPAICFAGIGDNVEHSVPLQVTNFEQNKRIDAEISKLWLGVSGGGNDKESYLEAMYYFSRPDLVEFPNQTPNTKPFLFITGDEGLYQRLDPSVIHNVIDPNATGVPSVVTPISLPVQAAPGSRFRVELSDGRSGVAVVADQQQNSGETIAYFSEENSNSEDPWAVQKLVRALTSRYHVFHIRKPYYGSTERTMKAQWCELLTADRVVMLSEPKACIDIMLGIISIVCGARTLEEYVQDLVERGQDEHRQEQIRSSLANVRRFEGDGAEGEEGLRIVNFEWI